MNVGDLFAISGDMILAQSVETMLVTEVLESTREGATRSAPPMMLLQFDGNRSEDGAPATTQVGMSLDAAYALQGSILTMLEAHFGIENGPTT